MDTKDRHLMHAALFAAALAALPPALPAEPAGPPAPAPLAATRWTADVSDARPFQARVMRGASHLLEARFREGRDAAPIPDGSTASMLWQTNGMGSAWWSAPATVESNAVSAVWTPEMDCGAPLYRAFLRVDAPGGADYSAFATLLMLDSPGAVPNELPPPVRSIDFARVAVTNAPWALPSEVEAAIEAAIDAADLGAYAKLDGSRPFTGEVAIAPGGSYYHVGLSGDGIVYQESEYSDRQTLSFPQRGGQAVTAEMLEGYARKAGQADDGKIAIIDNENGGIADGSFTEGELLGAAREYADAAAESTRAIVATWEQFLDGSNVVFSITNYVSGAYNPDAAKLRIMELRDGAYREVYNSRDEILMHVAAFSNGYVRASLDALADEVAARLAAKADRDWGKYTSAGGDAPSNTVYMTAPQTVFAGGLEYERVAVGEGAVCVLSTRGAPVYAAGDEGTFRFQSDGGTNYFGFSKTDSYTIGCDTDGISVEGGVVTLDYSVTMSGVPCVWYKSDLASPEPWEQLNTPDGEPVEGATILVQWEERPDPGRETCYISLPGDSPRAFFRATVEAGGSAKFETNMPADFSGGVLCTDGETVIYPRADGTWGTSR